MLKNQTLARSVRGLRARSLCTLADGDEQNNRIVVFGGGGYVGGAICKAALAKGMKVTSINRSGPSSDAESWVSDVEWVKGGLCTLNGWWLTLLWIRGRFRACGVGRQIEGRGRSWYVALICLNTIGTYILPVLLRMYQCRPLGLLAVLNSWKECVAMPTLLRLRLQRLQVCHVPSLEWRL
jgi:hypothetical protein